MPKAGRTPIYYAVAKGHSPGIYETWSECEAHVKGFHGAKYKKFHTIVEAEAWIASGGSSKPLSTADVGASSKQPPAASDGVTNVGGASGSNAGGTTKDGWLVVYCDGACKGNGKRSSVAGVGVWWGQGDPRNIAERCPGGQTNNRAELIAIVRVLENAPKDHIPLEIRTDSQYSIKCLGEWLPKWQRNGFKSSSGGEVKNAVLIRYIAALLNERGRLGQKVVFQHVYGHRGEVGNEGADYQANLGCLLPESEEPDWAMLEIATREEIAATQPNIAPDRDNENATVDTTVDMQEIQVDSSDSVIDDDVDTTEFVEMTPAGASKIRSTKVEQPIPPLSTRRHRKPYDRPSSSTPHPNVLQDVAVQTLPYVHPLGYVPQDPTIIPHIHPPAPTPQFTKEDLEVCLAQSSLSFQGAVESDLNLS
ncbi:hypothetical protein PHLCEN_2v11118 [Hermanssonia centrifuga]|uniref:Ribonuclease H n=1 Tax=Hermanssonia centrifuga TaxID=98765 RepID=A0A2R6NKW1_9APHY|nr:hypothetical protein PHLCEN_2v11118 [Hermanssonia centrifuga]